MKFKNNCPSLEPWTSERGDHCFSAGIQWPIELQSCARSLEEEVSQLLEEIDQQGKQEKVKAYCCSGWKVWLFRPRLKLLWRMVRRSVSTWKKSSTWIWLGGKKKKRRAARRKRESSRRSLKKPRSDRSWLTCDTTGSQKPNSGFTERSSRICSRTKKKYIYLHTWRQEETKNQEDIQIKSIQSHTSHVWTHTQNTNGSLYSCNSSTKVTGSIPDISIVQTKAALGWTPNPQHNYVSLTCVSAGPAGLPDLIPQPSVGWVEGMRVLIL